jgi:hypothetical protein
LDLKIDLLQYLTYVFTVSAGTGLDVHSILELDRTEAETTEDLLLICILLPFHDGGDTAVP